MNEAEAKEIEQARRFAERNNITMQKFKSGTKEEIAKAEMIRAKIITSIMGLEEGFNMYGIQLCMYALDNAKWCASELQWVLHNPRLSVREIGVVVEDIGEEYDLY